MKPISCPCAMTGATEEVQSDNYYSISPEEYLTRIRGFRATKGLCLKSFLR
jgi:hypothetical protein